MLHTELLSRFHVKKVFCGGKIKIPMAFLLFFFRSHLLAYRILVTRPGIKLRPLAVKALSPNHWTIREFPAFFLFFFFFMTILKVHPSLLKCCLRDSREGRRLSHWRLVATHSLLLTDAAAWIFRCFSSLMCSGQSFSTLSMNFVRIL